MALKKTFSLVSIKLKKHLWKFGRTSKSCGITGLWPMFPHHFLVLPTVNSISIIWDMENIFYVLKIVSVEHETVVQCMPFSSCGMLLENQYHKLQYYDNLRICFMWLVQQLCCAIVRKVAECQSCYWTLSRNSLQCSCNHWKKCNPAKEQFEMFVSRGITPGNYWNIVCLCIKIERNVWLKRLKLQCWLY